jgi:hypothetical protein
MKATPWRASAFRYGPLLEGTKFVTRKAMLVQEGKVRPDRTSRSTPGNGLAIRDRLAKSDPGNALWQRDLIASYKMIADCSPSKEKRANFSRALDCGRAVSLQAARARRRMNAR